MRLTLRQLQIFNAIAHDGSTAAAARSVPLSQSAASAALAELERALGAVLFDRVGKRLVLNDNGRVLLPLARAIMDGARHIETSFAPDQRRTLADLRLYASTTIGNYIMPPLLAHFRELAPDARLELKIGNTRDVISAVCDFVTDLGFIEGPCHAPEVLAIPWLEDELLIVAAPHHPLARAARRRRLTAQQLGRAQWLLREAGSGTREVVELALSAHVPDIPFAMTLGSSEAIRNAVAQGLGLSCLSRSVVQEAVNAGVLCVLPTRLPRLTRRFAIIHHKRKLFSSSLRRFMAHCQAHGGVPAARAAGR